MKFVYRDAGAPELNRSRLQTGPLIVLVTEGYATYFLVTKILKISPWTNDCEQQSGALRTLPNDNKIGSEGVFDEKQARRRTTDLIAILIVKLFVSK